MLKRLQISNFALIEKLDISFPGELSVITGETGAGKSIFIEAFSLVLGQRADSASIRKGAKKCIVEAEFFVEGLGLDALFAAADIEADQHLVMRRELSPDGKSRCFINDALVNLSVLKKFGERLVDIHSQHQTLLLNQSAFQINLLDAFAKNTTRLNDYRKTFKEWQQTEASLAALRALETQSLKEQDYIQFQLNELNELKLKKGLLLQLEEEVAALGNAETIREILTTTVYQCNGHDSAVLHQLTRLKQQVQSIAKYGQQYNEIAERLQAAVVELKDLVNTAEQEETRIQTNDKRLLELSNQLDLLNRILKKHGVKDEEALMQLRDDFEEKLSSYLSVASDIKRLSKTSEELYQKTLAQAAVLSEKRHQATVGLNKEVLRLLKELSLENAAFEVQLHKTEVPSSDGVDQVTFLFSANKGLPLSDIRKTASGGELSRLMLCLKSILAESAKLPTIIFDEIDTGVSGLVAEQIGRLLADSGKKMQVIAITHLPQLASKGKHHLYVYKLVDGDETTSCMRELKKEERKEEIAKMLSAGKPSATALKNAAELLAAGQ